MPAGQALLHTSRRADADAALLTAPDVAPFTWRRLLRALRDPDLEVLEVAEPLWLGEWRRALRYIVLAKAMRVVRRRPVAIATYAIENFDARQRLRRRSARFALGVSLLTLDAVVFGTTGAYENYRRAFAWSLRRARHTVRGGCHGKGSPALCAFMLLDGGALALPEPQGLLAWRTCINAFERIER